MTPAESVKDSWSAIFRRKGANGTHTRLFDSLEPPQQALLLKALGTLRKTELPVIGSAHRLDNWLVLTTERLIWCIEGNRKELDVYDIGAVKPDETESMRDKQNMKRLEVETVSHKRYLSNARYLIELDAGEPLFGVWHILLNIGRRNHKKPAPQ